MKDKEMKIYISGAITKNEKAEAQFERAEKWLKENGHQPINPLKVGKPLTEILSHEEYMKLSFTLIDIAGGVYLLDGWQSSEGAKAELSYAKATGKAIKFENKQWKFKRALTSCGE